MREPERLADGTLAELPPYFVRMERGGITCRWCGEGRVTLEPTLSEEAAMGTCGSCGMNQVYTCPPGMAYIRGVGDKPPSRKMGQVIRFRPRA